MDSVNPHMHLPREFVGMVLGMSSVCPPGIAGLVCVNSLVSTTNMGLLPVKAVTWLLGQSLYPFPLSEGYQLMLVVQCPQLVIDLVNPE